MLLLLLTGAALFLTVTRLELKTDWVYLFADDDPELLARQHYRAQFPLPNDMAILIDGGPEKSRQLFVERMIPLLEAEPEYFQHVLATVDLDPLFKRALFYLNTEQLEEVHHQLKAYRSYLVEILDGGPEAVLDLLVLDLGQADPQRRLRALRLTQAFLDLVEEALKNNKVPLPTDDIPAAFEEVYRNRATIYLRLDDARTYLMLVKPVHTDDPVAPMAASVKRLRQLVAQVVASTPGVRARITGEPVLLNDERDTTARDTLKSSVLSLALISLLFFFFYRTAAGPALAIGSLLMGLVWTLGLTTLTIGHLNFITVTYIPMLMGLGIDFAIHLLFRLNEESRRHPEVNPPFRLPLMGEPDSFKESIMTTGRDVAFGALTTAGAFATMRLAGFRGVAELGIIAATGVLCCCLSALTFIPTMLTLFPDLELGWRRRTFLQRMDSFLCANWSSVASIAAGLALVSLILAQHVTFDYNLLKMQAAELESISTEMELINRGQSSVMAAISLRDTLDEIRRLSEAMETKESVRRVLSLALAVPEVSPHQLELAQDIAGLLKGLQHHEVELLHLSEPELLTQMKRLRWAVDSQARESEEVEKLEAEVVSRFDRLGELILDRGPGPLLDAVNLVQSRLATEADAALPRLLEQQGDPPTLEHVPEELKVRAIGENGQFAAWIRPQQNIWNRSALRQFFTEVRQVDPESTGDPLLMSHFQEVVRETHQRTIWTCLTAVFLFTAFYVRRPIRVVLTFLPTALGVLGMYGLMGFTGVAFNPANFVALPMLVGVAAVFGIHVVHRCYELRGEGLLGSSTGPAVLLSALTSIIGFSSLMTAAHRGIASLGFVISAGILATLATALLLLPCLCYQLKNH